MLIPVLQRRPLLTLFLSFVCSLFGLQGIHAQHIVINEYMASNGTVFADEDGDYEDWIELYNADSIAVNLGNWSITDDPSRLRRWVFPNVILNPGDFLVFFASGKNRKEGPYFHTNFRISASGEPLILSDPSGTIIDQHEPIPIPRDVSYGRMPDGGPDLTFFYKPTPGFSNLLSETWLPENTLTPNRVSGFYHDSFYLKFLDQFDSGVVLYYTLNGSDPKTSDSILSDSLLILDRTSEPNHISIIRTTPLEANYGEDYDFWWAWREPKGAVFKGTSLKVQAFIGDSAVSGIHYLSYFVNQSNSKKYTFPVISIIIPESSLFDYNQGIYVPGVTADQFPEWSWYWGHGNFYNTGSQWERNAFIQYIDTSNHVALERSVGLRIHGNASRVLPIKSLRLYSRPDFNGNHFNFQFFSESDFTNYERILLRNSGQDFNGVYFNDAFTQSFVDELGIECQRYQPSIVFINGEYWGIHNMRERIDERFLAYRKNANPNNLDLIQYSSDRVEEESGDYSHFQSEVVDFLENNLNNLNHPSVYEHLNHVIDIANHIDFHITKIFFGVYDWPGNNVRIWRERKPDSKYRWISFDNDDAFLRPNLNSIWHATRDDRDRWPTQAYATFVFRNLLNIDRYKDSFLNRFEYLINHNFHPQRVDSIYMAFASVVEPEMGEHIDRWQFPSSKSTWKENVNNIRTAISNRYCVLRETFIDFFEIEDENFLKEVCELSHVSKVELPQSILIYPNPNRGTFKLALPVDLRTNGNELLTIYSTSGKQVFSSHIKSLNFNHLNTSEVRLEGLSPGVYIVKFNTGNQTLTGRFVTY